MGTYCLQNTKMYMLFSNFVSTIYFFLSVHHSAIRSMAILASPSLSFSLSIYIKKKNSFHLVPHLKKQQVPLILSYNVQKIQRLLHME